MRSRMQHLLRTTRALLVLVVLLSGPASSATTLEVRQEPPMGVVQGSGDFPRLPVVAVDEDGITLALYLVEGGTATQLVTLEGTRVGSNSADVQLSPDGRYVACLRTEGEDVHSILEVVDTQEAQRAIIAEGPGGTREKGAASQELVSVAWMDAEHVLYSKVHWPSSEEWQSSWEAGTPPPIQGEVWLSGVDGKEQHLLARDRIHRVLGASPDGQTVYVTRLIPGQEENREEGFALVDVASGEMKNLWPPEERGAERYFSFTSVTLPDGTQGWLFATAERVDTAPGQPPVIWSGDVESGEAEAIWTVDRGNDWSKGEMTGTVYDIPTDFSWSPKLEREFVYLADGVLNGVWRVDLDAGAAEPLSAMEAVKGAGLRLLAWTAEGIVIQNQDALWLVDEGGEVRGEIHFQEETAGLASPQLLSTVVNWDLPYIHQLYDTPAWFDGHWACGPTSVVMALAYYQRLTSRVEGYGWYVPNKYTQQSACSGATYFDTMQYDPRGRPYEAWGAYGWCTSGGAAIASLMYDYAQRHDVGYYFEGTPSESAVKAELRGGAVVMLATDLTPEGHIVAVRGYTNDNPVRFIVNDPNGNERDGYPNDNGNGVQYTWAEMSPRWYIALYSPQYLPDLRKNSAWDGTITVRNGAQGAGWNADVKVCFMNTSGSLVNTEDSPSIPPKGSWSLPLSSVFGGSTFNGSAAVMITQTAVSALVENRRPGTQAIAAYPGLRAGQAATKLSLPLIFYDINSAGHAWYTRVYVQNPGSATANVSVTFNPNPGGGVGDAYTSQQDIPPNGRRTFSHYAAFFGSAVLTSDQPVVATVHEYNDDGDGVEDFTSAYPALRGATTAQLPLLFKEIYSQGAYWYTNFAVQNVGTGGTSVRIVYTCEHPVCGVGNTWTRPEEWIWPNEALNFDQRYDGLPWAQFFGSAEVTSLDGQPIAVTVNQRPLSGGLTNRLGTYVGDGGGAPVHLPRLQKYVADGGISWSTSVAVRNAGDQDAHIELRYYSTAGSQVGSVHSETILPGRMANIDQRYDAALSNLGTFDGTGVLSSDRPVAVEVNRRGDGGAGTDKLCSYNGITP